MSPEQIAALCRAAADDAYRLTLIYIEAGFRRKEAVQIVARISAAAMGYNQEESK